MSDRRVCVHAHFYQPPRENPWTDALPREPSADPWPNWNERIADECYGPNAAADLHREDGRVTKKNNYEAISFNVGPTLMAWLAAERPGLHEAIVAADAAGAAARDGHGGAIAQAHDHVILPLATPADRRTQIAWGLADFRFRFGRPASGMWLPETAVDVASLEALAEAGVRYTILAPHQARRVREPGGEWMDVAGALDTGRAYRCPLPSGREIDLFFYDGPLAHAVAFGGLLHDGARFADRLETAGSAGEAPRLAHVATDGETFGHHHRHGEMALAWALDALKRAGRTPPTTYGAWLAAHPSEHEVEIAGRTSWSCAHGVRRWAGGCGCGIAGEGGDHAWRGSLRRTFDRFRAVLDTRFAAGAPEVLVDPAAARDEAAVLWLEDASARDAWTERHVRPGADPTAARRWIAEQRAAMRMFTSCGWFFEDPAGLETRQVLRYAGRALDFTGGVAADGAPVGPLAESLLEGLETVRSARAPGWTAAVELKRILREDRPAGVSPPAG